MSSLVRRMQIRALKLLDVSKVPSDFDTSRQTAPKRLVWPKKYRGQLYPTNPKAKDLLARLEREAKRKK